MSQRNENWISKYGPWALVTGASDGIGLEMARDIAARGLNVLLVARRQEKLTGLAQSIIAEFGVQAQVLSADLAKAQDVRRVIDESARRDAGLLVSAAGYGTAGAFTSIDPEAELDMLAVNCAASLALAHAFARRLAPQKRGGIILFGSLVAFQGVPFAANYAATKAYIQTLAEGLHSELRKQGVDVLAVAPGPVHTGFAARSGMKLGTAANAKDVAREAVAALGRKSTVRPGLQAKLLIGGLAVLPRKARTAIMGRIMASMTTHET
jgi:uncharacterized protein